jgi:hypothetical protein
VPKMPSGKISLARGIYCCSNILYFFCPTSVFILWRTCVCIWLCTDCMLLPNTEVKNLYTNGSSAKCWLDIYRWGAGLAVTGPIRDIGLKVLQSSFETGSSSSPVTAKFCCLSRSSRRSLLQK